MTRHHEVGELCFDSDDLVLTVDGQSRRCKLSEISSALQNASDEERSTYEISPSGYGIHWPLLDEDLSIDGLLGVVHSSSGSRSPRKTS